MKDLFSKDNRSDLIIGIIVLVCLLLSSNIFAGFMPSSVVMVIVGVFIAACCTRPDKQLNYCASGVTKTLKHYEMLVFYYICDIIYSIMNSPVCNTFNWHHRHMHTPQWRLFSI